jgi:hypothetical protein
VKAARRNWVEAVVAYSVSGAITSALVGALLGKIGQRLHSRAAVYALLPVVLALAARELGFLRFALPEWKRQTDPGWIRDYGFVMASAMWGFHLGIGFVTRITFGGFWALTLLALSLGGVKFGIGLLLTYWSARALSVLLAPVMFRMKDICDVSLAVLDERLVCKQLAGVGLVWAVAITLIVVAQNRL